MSIEFFGRAALFAAGLLAAGLPALAQEKLVATVNGAAITETDLRLAEKELSGDLADMAADERRRAAIEAVIRQQLFATAPEAARLAAGPELAARVNYARRRALAELYVETVVQTAVKEADARSLYDKQAPAMKSQEEVRVRHILVTSAELAAQVRAKIAAGTDFATLARALSADAETAALGGDLGYRGKGQMEPRFAAAAFALRTKGELSQPVETPAGWHVIRLDDRRPRSVPEFAKVKEFLRKSVARSRTAELAIDLRRKAKIAYLDPALQPEAAAASTPTTPPAPAGVTPAANPLVAASAKAAVAPPMAAPPAAAGRVLTPIAIPPAARASHWRHDGSLVKLYADGERLVMQFETPRTGLDATGIKPGTQLFHGTRRGKTYSGEATTFSPHCGARTFSVSGQAAADGNSFKVQGNRPVLDAGCKMASEQSEVLVFEYVGPAAR